MPYNNKENYNHFGKNQSDNSLSENYYFKTQSTTNEAYSPEKLSFKGICLYPFKTENLFFTISILGAELILTNTALGLFFAIFLNILYGIYLIRKILNIKETFTADAHLFIFFLYDFIINCISFGIIAYVFDSIAKIFLPENHYSIFSLQYGNEYLFINMLSPIVSFVNIVFFSGFIITFAIAEDRAFFTYWRYKRELFFYNTLSFIALIIVFKTGINILSIDINNDILRTFITIMINLCSSYVILVSIISWSGFLRKDLYPEINKGEEI